jgi:hypothetical protein
MELNSEIREWCLFVGTALSHVGQQIVRYVDREAMHEKGMKVYWKSCVHKYTHFVTTVG